MNYTIVAMIAAQGGALGAVVIFLVMIVFISTAPMMPRLIIGVREVYDRDLHGRWKGIDSGFDALSQPLAGGDAVVSAIAFEHPQNFSNREPSRPSRSPSSPVRRVRSEERLRVSAILKELGSVPL